MLKDKTRRVERLIKVHKVIKGSLVWLKRVCGKPGCRCCRGKKHESLYLSRSLKGRTTMTYIPHKYEDVVVGAVAEYKRILETLDELSQSALKAIKEKKGI